MFQDDPVVSIKNISKQFGEKLVLKDISLSISKEDFIAIVGASGCGKSTLLNIIGLLDTPTAGSYLFSGVNVTTLNDKNKSFLRNKQIGFVFQMYNLIPGLTVRENILVPFIYGERVPKKKQQESLEEIVDFLQITEIMNEKIDHLSGGERQRVAIARAMVKQPILLLCDEPTGNLDPPNTKVVFSALQKYAESGNSVLMVTHNVDLTNQMNKVFLLENGVLTCE